MPRRTVLAALLVALTAAPVGACQSGEAIPVSDPSAIPTPTSQAQSAATVKRLLEPLLALGVPGAVTQDGPVGCTGDPSGETYAATYGRELSLDAAARDRLLAEVVPQWTAQGWQVRDDLVGGGTRLITFSRDGYRVGLSIGMAEGDDRAVAQGSGPCLPRD